MYASYDTLGNVYWKPAYEVVDRLEGSKRIPLIVEVRNQSGQRDKRQVIGKYPSSISDKNIQNTFQDFNPDTDKSIYINE